MKNLIVCFQIIIAAVCFTNCAKDEEDFDYVSIAGIVVDAKTENPIAGAKVYLIKYATDNSFQWVNESTGGRLVINTIDSTETAIDGTYSFSKLGSAVEISKTGYISIGHQETVLLYPEINGEKVKVALKPL